jgi:hypothetical protein
MRRQLVLGAALLIMFASSAHAQRGRIPANAFKGARTVTFTQVRGMGGTLGRVGKDAWVIHASRSNRHDSYWSIDFKASNIVALHGWSLNENNLQSSVDKAALVYDVTGEDDSVYYRVPDERWSSTWVHERPLNDKPKGVGKYLPYQYLRVEKGERKGWYLEFDETPSKITGDYGGHVTVHQPRLVKEPTDAAKLELSGALHSGVSP